MAKLIVSLDGLVLKHVALNKERLTIGRRPYNDIVLDSLVVSGEHALIVTLGHISFLEDLESTNGTKVNGKPQKKYQLIHQDNISVGSYKLVFVDDAELGLPRIGLTADNAQKALDTDAESFKATRSPPAPILKVINGPLSGKTLTLTKPLTTLGRPGIQVAVISKRLDAYHLAQIEGNKDLLINGVVIKTPSYVLCDGDIIELAGVRLIFTELREKSGFSGQA